MDRNEIARARAQTMTKRPAEVTRAEPLTLRAVRATARPVQVVAPGRLARFNAWRQDHYVADQLMRVAAIATGAGLALFGAILLLVWAVGSLIEGAGGVKVVVQTGVGIVIGVAILAALGASLGRKSDGHGSSGYGFHWSKCK